ncbi:MAG: MBL fold metallo-hydrolase [Oscillospiraceae bacterium]|nr:MBL fold metallo-hydrolase [Oscillospiraceae bacterium]
MNRSRIGRITAALLALLLAMSFIVPAAASTTYREITVIYPGIVLNVDGKLIVPRDANGDRVEPFAWEGTTYLPIRAIAEALGKQVRWESNTKTVYLTDGGGQAPPAFSGRPVVQGADKNGSETIMAAYMGIKINVNGVTIQPRDENGKAVQPFAYDGTTYLPVRAVGAAFGKRVTWNSAEKTIYLNNQISGMLKVCFLDVGEADSIFIVLPNGETMLIDAAEKGDGDNISRYIKAQGITKIHYLVATHPHADHIGGMEKIVDAFEIGAVYFPNAAANTKTFETLLLAMKRKGLTIKTAKAGVNILSQQGLNISILAPNQDHYEDLNNYSAVVKLTYGKTRFLFMGDAEALSENEIITDVKADVLKVGHHGSSSSTSGNFLNRVSPQYAVISVGKGNAYGHPSQQVVDRLTAAGAKIYRTDRDGTVVFTSDGTKVTPSFYQ